MATSALTRQEISKMKNITLFVVILLMSVATFAQGPTPGVPRGFLRRVGLFDHRPQTVDPGKGIPIEIAEPR